MKTYLAVPRQALVDLLKSAGVPLTPEEFVASLGGVDAFRKYPSRAWAAAMSKYFLLVVAIFGVVSLPFLGFTIENVIVVVGLVVVTYFEYRVHAYFLGNDPRAPGLGFRNQALFVVAILIYCLYHAFTPFQLTSQDQMQLLEQNSLIDAGMLKTIVRFFYLFIAVLAGGSQFGLACYYRSAQAK